MIKRIFASVFLCLASIAVSAQAEQYSAPVKWENYKVSRHDVSISLPKMPILIADANPCAEEESSQYAAFAENVVYGFKITYKTKSNVPRSMCPQKTSFSRSNLEIRLNEIKSATDASEETKFKQNGLDAIKIRSGLFTYRFFDDFKNDRWFEVWVATKTENDENNIKIKNFIESFKIEKNAAGIEIGTGSPRTLGDESSPNKSGASSIFANNVQPEKQTTEKFKIILKPRSSYTQSARAASAQGAVLLKVTLLAGGGIGTISVVNGLPFGLTEEAIAAASKIVFIPANRNGINYSVVVPIEYKFSIY